MSDNSFPIQPQPPAQSPASPRLEPTQVPSDERLEAAGAAPTPVDGRLLDVEACSEEMIVTQESDGSLRVERRGGGVISTSVFVIPAPNSPDDPRRAGPESGGRSESA